MRVFIGSVNKPVTRYITCDKCGCQFMFSAAGYGFALVQSRFTDQSKQANELAMSRANAMATSTLAPCPDCGWHNTGLVKIYKQQRFRRQQRLVWIVAAPVVMMLFLAFDAAGAITAEFLLSAGAVVVAAALILLALKALGENFNPNANWPEGRVPLACNNSASRTPEYEQQIAAWRIEAATKAWYFTTDRQRGPVSFKQLGQLLQNGQLQMTDSVWSEGMAEWLPVIAVVK